MKNPSDESMDFADRVIREAQTDALLDELHAEAANLRAACAALVAEYRNWALISFLWGVASWMGFAAYLVVETLRHR